MLYDEIDDMINKRGAYAHGAYAKRLREWEEERRLLRDEGLTTRASSLIINETGSYDPAVAAWVLADYFSQADLMRVPNCGKTTVKEISLWLERRGYELQGTYKRCPHCGGTL